MELTNHGGSHDIICHYINALVYHGLSMFKCKFSLLPKYIA